MVQKGHYLAVKCVSGWFKGVTSNHVGDFYWLNCFHLLRTESKLKNHKNVFKYHNYCYVEMPKEDSKSVKVPFIIYADMEFSLRK